MRFRRLIPLALAVGAVEVARRARASERESRRRISEGIRARAIESAPADLLELGAIAVVIPAYNEAGSIGDVLDSLPAELGGRPVRPVVVVDGGDDGTDKVAADRGVVAVRHETNLGQGDALRTGFAWALRNGAAIVMTMDADGQHATADLPALVNPIVDDEADYVQGSRYLGEYDDAGGARDLGIRVLTRFVALLAGVPITDCTNGFRAIRADGLDRMVLEEQRFSAPEIIIQAAQRGLRVLEVPVHILSRSAGESKKPRRLGYPIGFSEAALRARLRRARAAP